MLMAGRLPAKRTGIMIKGLAGASIWSDPEDNLVPLIQLASRG